MFGKMDLSAVILAGGDSKRMGTNKAFLTLDNACMIDLIVEKLAGMFHEVLIVTDRGRDFQHLNAVIVSDIIKQGEKNALRGIHAGLFHVSSPASFFMACDMPFLSPPLIHFMSQYALQYDAVIPRVGEYFQPLFAFYHRRVLDRITRSLEQENFKITDFYAGLNMKEIDEASVRRYDPGMRSFFNINTREDYEQAQSLFAREKS